MKKDHLFLYASLLLGFYAFFLSVAGIITPFFQSKSLLGISQILSSFLGHHCHQIPERSISIFGSPMGLCARCFSFYTAFWITVPISILIKGHKYWRFGIFLIIPLLLDGLTQLLGLRTSTNHIRIITGILAGIGVAISLRSIIWLLTDCLLGPFISVFVSARKSKFAPYLIMFLIILSSYVVLDFDTSIYSKTKNEIIMKQYTQVILSLRENVSSENKRPGEIVQLVVLEDVTIDGTVVINSGSPVKGRVSVAKEAASLGEPGEVAIVPECVEAVDGQKIRLGGTLYVRGKDKEVSTAVLTAICLPFALRGGGKAIVTEGSELKAYVEKDYKIRLDK
jgi:uncharacterized membrane protein